MSTAIDSSPTPWTVDATAAELVAALRELLPWLEAAETKVLVGDEGCVWAVEQVRALLSRVRS